MWKRQPLDPPSEQMVRVGFAYHLSETGLSLSEEAGFTRLRLEGGHVSAEPGAPEIPYLIAHIAIPEGARVRGVKVMQTTWERINGTHVVMPAQLPGLAELRLRPPQLQERFDNIRRANVPETEARRLPFTPPDPVKYKLKGYYPPAVAEVSAEQRFGQYRVLAVRVNPVQYRPAEGSLWVNRDFTLAVDLTKPAKRPPAASAWGMAQLERWHELISAMVINPEDLRLPEEFTAPAAEAPYLIVTSVEMRPEFDRLAEWKTSTGLPARVVTMEEILAKVYGDFNTGAGGTARDTQEVLRNFLKWARGAWKVCYLLLGGDTDVIPVRQVAALSHYNWYTKTSIAKPEEDRCRYDPVRNQTNVRMKAPLAAATPLLAITSGRRIPHNVRATAARPGWYWATSDTYTVKSAAPTQYVVIKGPAAVIDDAAGFYRIESAHSIPTDLYYASLESPLYNRPARHDWDLRNTGLYGYYNESGDPSGIDFVPDLCVGRVPCSGLQQAQAVVDKLIRYEKYEGIKDLAARKALFAADYWFGPVLVEKAPATVSLPGENQYKLAGTTTCKLRLKEAPGTLVDLIAEDSPTEFRKLPYRANASAALPGWYYAQGPSTLAASQFHILGLTFPIPTPYIVVRGPAGTLTPNWYWVDNAGPDLALTEKEQVRALFRAQAHRVDLHRRLYRDFASVPTAAPGDAVVTAMLTEDDLTSLLNAGAAFCSLSGHGWWGGCCTVGTDDAKALTNGISLPVMFSDSCSTGSFDQNDSFGEEMLLNPAGGAIAYLGNTRWSWIGLGDDIERIFWHKLFGFGSSTRRLGVAFDARMQILTTPGWKMLWKWSCLALNLLGDPAMRPWAGVPMRMHVKAPLKTTRFSTIVVGVADASGMPVPGALVCLYQRGTLFRTGISSAQGTVMLSVSGAHAGTLTVTATKPGCVPSQVMTTLA